MKKWVKNILVLFFIGVGIFVIENSASGGFENKDFKTQLLTFGIYQLYTFVIGSSNMYFLDYMEKRKWKHNDGVKRIILGFVGGIVITIICFFFLNMFVDLYFEGRTFEEFIKRESFQRYKISIWITATVIIVFQVIYFYNKYQQNRIKEQKVIAGTCYRSI